MVGLIGGMLGFKPRLYQGQTTRLQLELKLGMVAHSDIDLFAGHFGAAAEFEIFEQAILALGVGACLTTGDFILSVCLSVSNNHFNPLDPRTSHLRCPKF